MAKSIRHVFHSTLSRKGWIVTEGGEIVARNSNQKANEAAAIAAGRKARERFGLTRQCCTRAMVKFEKSAPMARTPKGHSG